jgi:hypothetical protein
LALRLESIQQREEHWVVADLVGKGRHVRTAPIPLWAKVAIDAWVTAAGLTHGRVFRAIDKSGTRLEDGMSPKVLWDGKRQTKTVLTSCEQPFGRIGKGIADGAQAAAR